MEVDCQKASELIRKAVYLAIFRGVNAPLFCVVRWVLCCYQIKKSADGKIDLTVLFFENMFDRRRSMEWYDLCII